MEYDLNYIILQSKYRKMFKNSTNIFPKEWYNVKEYKIKKDILNECIDKKCLIIDCSRYLELKKIALK